MTSSLNNTTLQIYRNTEYTLSVTFTDNGKTLLLYNYSFALQIAPITTLGFGTPCLIYTNPTIDYTTGIISFMIPETDTNSLSPSFSPSPNYNFVVQAQAFGTGAEVVKSGTIQVFDAPPMPIIPEAVPTYTTTADVELDVPFTVLLNGQLADTTLLTFSSVVSQSYDETPTTYDVTFSDNTTWTTVPMNLQNAVTWVGSGLGTTTWVLAANEFSSSGNYSVSITCGNPNVAYFLDGYYTPDPLTFNLVISDPNV